MICGNLKISESHFSESLPDIKLIFLYWETPVSHSGSNNHYNSIVVVWLSCPGYWRLCVMPLRNGVSFSCLLLCSGSGSRNEQRQVTKQQKGFSVFSRESAPFVSCLVSLVCALHTFLSVHLIKWQHNYTVKQGSRAEERKEGAQRRRRRVGEQRCTLRCL